MEIIIIGIIIIFIVSYRTKQGESVYKFISEQAINTYKKIEPYSFKVMRDKVKELGLEYTPISLCRFSRRYKLFIFL